MSYKTFEWSRGDAWAGQCIYRNGKYWYYLPVNHRVEAETIAWEEGVETTSDSKTGVYVTDIDNGDYIKVRSIDFGKGAKSFEAGVASIALGKFYTNDKTFPKLEIRMDRKDGPLLGTCLLKSSDDPQKWSSQSCKVDKARGVHDIFFVFKGGEGHLFNFDWWQFKQK